MRISMFVWEGVYKELGRSSVRSTGCVRIVLRGARILSSYDMEEQHHNCARTEIPRTRDRLR